MPTSSPAPERSIPAPVVTPETRRFWEAANEERLLLPRCRACGKVHYYPRARCPFCFGPADEWIEARGEGEIYSYSIMRRADPPYVIAYVSLPEGVRMLTNIIGADFDELAIGQKVRLVFVASESGQKVPMFTPIAP
jgi:uncharacterized OB-fold protein